MNETVDRFRFTLYLNSDPVAVVRYKTGESMLGSQAEQEWPKTDPLHNATYKEPIPPHAMSLS
jgi:hypothetical protein